MPLRPPWSELHLSVGKERLKLAERNQDSSLVPEKDLCFPEAYGHQTSEKTQDLVGKKEGKQRTAYSVPSEPLFLWMAI